MAEYGEWNRKGASLSDVTARKEYGVSWEFIVKGIKAGKLEYQEGAVWGNPYLRVLRRQLEAYLAEQAGSKQLETVKRQAELRKVKKEIASLKKTLAALQTRKGELEKALGS
jgi:flagellar motility protein MotE (MotC chaperone)